MFFDPLKGQLIDYVDGQTDLHARILRAIGAADRRFEEDKLRLLRAVRLATRFELTIEPATETAIKAHAAQINVVSAERIAEELRQLLVHPRRSEGVRLLSRVGLVEPLLPELMPLEEVSWERLLSVLDFLGSEPAFPLALAGLLHRVGTSADEICLRFRLSNSDRERTVWLVDRYRSLDEIRTMRTCRVKQLLIEPGIHELLALYRAVALAEGRGIDPVEYCQKLLRDWTQQDLNPAPFITGQDLIDLGLKPGPRFKEILDAVRDAQLDGVIHSKEEAMELVRQLAIQ
jgi:poly(A) polymerase